MTSSKVPAEMVHLFMEGVRRVREEKHLSMAGPTGLDSGRRRDIANIAASDDSGTSREVNTETKTALLTHFEETCRRLARNNLHPDMTDDMRPAVLEQLLTELAANKKAFGAGKRELGKLVPITADSGAIGPTLRAEFPDLPPSTFMAAARDHHSAPRVFLSDVQSSFKRLRQDENFSGASDDALLNMITKRGAARGARTPGG